MTRPLLDLAQVHPNIQSKLGGNYADTLKEVQDAIASHHVVVVGMKQNPFCKKVRKHLDGAGVRYHYLEYGSYLKEWHRRLAIKMWSGWSTFPMVFVAGQLIGGNQETEAMLASGELAANAEAG
ncbi:glutaredoxin domain-containing protein [Spongiibacter sp.]|uniref:glutaredoxin domain-containing protein n=1 Tax=Spongiibacter sp. TaxID=2024860 RepID=UPI00356A9633